MTSRERVKATFAHRMPDRVPVCDEFYWPMTLERWRAEGLPEGVEPQDYFGLDRLTRFAWDTSLRLPTETIQETEDCVVYRNNFGTLVKDWKGRYATPVRLEWAVRDWASWNNLKERFDVTWERVDQERLAEHVRLREEDFWLYLRPQEAAWSMLEHIMGFECLLCSFYTQPDLVADIVKVHTDFMLGMLDLLADRQVPFDGVWFFSDLCYKNGMLWSPEFHRRFFHEAHQRYADWCHSRGVPMILHCDGDVRRLIPCLIECGFDAVQPLEARCGNDVLRLKDEYGDRIVLFGNISVEKLTIGGREMEEEIISKLTAAKRGGGYVYHCDHSIPPTVSLENYARAIELARLYGSYSSS